MISGGFLSLRFFYHVVNALFIGLVNVLGSDFEVADESLGDIALGKEGVDVLRFLFDPFFGIFLVMLSDHVEKVDDVIVNEGLIPARDLVDLSVIVLDEWEVTFASTSACLGGHGVPHGVLDLCNVGHEIVL